MKITIQKTTEDKLVRYEIDKPDFNDALKEAAIVDMLPIKCTLCGSAVTQTFRSPNNFNYPGVKCNNPECGADTSIQQKQDKSEHYCKPMQKWQDRKAEKESGGN